MVLIVLYARFTLVNVTVEVKETQIPVRKGEMLICMGNRELPNVTVCTNGEDCTEVNLIQLPRHLENVRVKIPTYKILTMIVTYSSNTVYIVTGDNIYVLDKDALKLFLC